MCIRKFTVDNVPNENFHTIIWIRCRIQKDYDLLFDLDLLRKVKRDVEQQRVYTKSEMTKRNETKRRLILISLVVNYLLIKLKDILMNIIYKKNFSWYVTRAWIMFIIVVAHPFAWPTLLYKTSVSRMRESIQPLLFLFRQIVEDLLYR